MNPEKASVGIIGVGIMGGSMGTRLLECGHRVTLFDRNPPKVAALVAKGAHEGGSPKAVAETSTFVITCVNSAAAVRGTRTVCTGSVTVLSLTW